MTKSSKPNKAVALQYDGAGTPRITAKGTGPVADKIVELAKANGVAIEENAGLAEALSAIELDQEIPIELYRAVAEVIAFVLRSANQKRR